MAPKLYSYVSLFGLNSLDDLRFAVFENTIPSTEIGNEVTQETLEAKLSFLKGRWRKIRPALEIGAAIFKRKDLADLMSKSAFMSVNSQLVCIDDIERGGEKLNVRDVLGLASFLRMERNCKVVLLLNDNEFDEKQEKEFKKQLEKVVDVSLSFEPTPEEAAAIAVNGDDKISTLLRSRCVDLVITNIRVIKKVETLSRRMPEIVDGLEEAVLEQAVATIVLAGWCVYQPSVAPTLDFICSYNQLSFAMREHREQLDDETKKWRDMLSGYPFRYADDFDQLLIKGVVAGYFRNDLVRQEAEKLSEQFRHQSRDTVFSRAWSELYHGSLTTEDDEFLDELYKGAIDEAGVISSLNINSAIRLLRECGREDQADEVIQNWFDAQGPQELEFYDIERQHFSPDDVVDEGFRAAFEERQAGYEDHRDPYEVLLNIAHKGSWRRADVLLLSKQSVDDLENIFERLRGNEVSECVELMLRISGNKSEFKENCHEALRRIGKKSPLRKRKVARFGIEINPEMPSEND